MLLHLLLLQLLSFSGESPRRDARITDLVVDIPEGRLPLWATAHITWTASNIYWLSVTLISLLISVGVMFSGVLGLFALLIWMPAAQFGASVLALVAVGLLPVTNKSAVLGNITRITLGSVIGTLVGGILLIPLLLLLL